MGVSRKHNLLVRVLTDITTIKNGRDFCPIRIAGLILFFAILYMGYYNALQGIPTLIGDKVLTVHNYPLKEIAEAEMQIILAVGGAIFAKQGDEPRDEPNGHGVKDD